MKLSVTLLILGSILLLSGGCAGTEKKNTNSVFQTMDTNDDDRVMKEEFAEYMKQSAFDQMDTNRNRAIGPEEWERMDVDDHERHSELFRKIDKNKDKRITFLEFSDYADRHSNIEEAFMVHDKDRDNSLALDEISTPPIFRMITIRLKR